MSEKRKHVVFEETSPTIPYESPTSSGAFQHPDRIAAIAASQPPPKKPKVKSEKQKQYLLKKAKKHRTLVKARKAAAPKNKDWKPEDETVNGGGAVSDEEKAIKDTSLSDGNAIAGPSTPPPSTKKSKKSTKDRVEVVPDAEDEEEEERLAKEKRKQEKREKREQRDRTAKRQKKQKLKETFAEKEDEKGKGKERAEVDEKELVEEEDTATQIATIGNDDSDQSDEAAVETQTQRAESDPIAEPYRHTLEAFPLPTPAPPPDPRLLSRQGLPVGLENATFIDQDLRSPLDDPSAGVSERMRKNLASMGIKDYFAVQAALLPHLNGLRLVPEPFDELSDYLISAPTGSGKTLAYAVPLVQILSSRVLTKLRALIVLPTKDLVGQVRDTLDLLSRGTNLKIGTITGQHSFSHEQHQLIADMDKKLLGGSSKLDILIATPGRLIEHLAQTPNFTLQHLRFLVIDEADRLLNQSYQNWLPQVLAHTRPPTEEVTLPDDFELDPLDHIAAPWLDFYGLYPGYWDAGEAAQLTCQKLLFSATLTRDPSSIASLSLRSPRYFIVQSSSTDQDTAAFGESFAIPSTLTERMLILPPALKPLNLIHLIHHPEWKVRGLIFVKSVESVGRLVNLLSAFEENYGGEKVVVKGYTSEMKPSERKKLLTPFSEGIVHVIVCSDLIARGMDLPSVPHVISYDAPLDMRKYVHRVGRTARAGREGTAWTLVEKQEAHHFKAMMKTAGREKVVRKIKVKEDELVGYRAAYDAAMSRLKEQYGRDH